MGKSKRRPDSPWTYHGEGVLSKRHRAHGDERRFYYVRYSHQGRRFTQQAGGTEKQARALLRRARAIDPNHEPTRELGRKMWRYRLRHYARRFSAIFGWGRNS